MGRLFDLQIDFFRPVWRRVVLVVFCLGWAIVEFSAGAPFWGMVFGGLGLLALWQFFFDGWPESESRESVDSDSQSGTEEANSEND